MRAAAAALLALSALAAAPAPAQSVGELVDRGALTLGAEELVPLLSGADFAGPGGSTVSWDLHLWPDGTLSGYQMGAPVTFPVTGDWSVDRQGRFCFFSAGLRGYRVRRCALVLSLGNAHYLAAAAEDRSADAIRVRFAR